MKGFCFVYLLHFFFIPVIKATAQPSNPTNYCGWMYAMLGPDRYFKNDTISICSGSTDKSNPGFTLPNTTYKWSNNLIYTSDSLGRIHSPPLTSAGQYWVDITKDGCTARDSLYILYVTPPSVKLGNDTTLCQGDSLVLDAGNPGAQYAWNGGSDDLYKKQVFTVTEAGKYRVRVFGRACYRDDTIEVNYVSIPSFSFDADKMFCKEEVLILSPGIRNVDYLWQDGSILPTFSVMRSGIYSVRLSNICGSSSAAINIIDGNCGLYVPTAFTPNYDRKNDMFKVLGYDNLSFFRFRVYNRWGSEVFSSSFPERGWDGALKGKPQPAGLYMWTLEYIKKYKTRSFLQKGTVLLIR